ncbi:MAG: glycosyltransferase [Cyanobacteria bacterium Co-bin8]|nr:glycosyltransferase [Cyanobacteria bacterium Co-bin8]
MTKRIALISEHASPLGIFGGTDSGGQNVYVGQIAKQLAAIGYSVDVFTRRDRTDIPDVVTWHNGVRIVHVPVGPARPVAKEKLLPYMEAFTEFVLAFMREERLKLNGSFKGRHFYDLIHANFWMSALVANQIKQQTGVPFVVTFHALGRVRRQHQGQADGFPDRRFAVEDEIVQAADSIVAECPQDRDDLIQLYQADPNKIRIIPCGVDAAEFWPIPKDKARATRGLPQDERIVLQLGRMVPRKGVDNALRGVAALNYQAQMPTRLLVVGGEASEPDPALTPEIGRLQTLAQELNLTDRVTFVGQRGREVLKYYYSAADIFVTTPWYEPFGITPLEAMACGTPVIGTNVGGIKFTVRDGETGYLVAPNEPQALCDRMAFLYRNPAMLNLFGRQAIRHVASQFTWPKVTSAIAALYEDVLTLEPQPITLPSEDIGELTRMEDCFDAAIMALKQSQQVLSTDILAAARLISQCFTQGGKVLVCGNGGSASDSQHFAAELVGRFRSPHRAGLPVIALTADTALITAWSNDVGYEDIFARQVHTFAQPGDVLLMMSTSGRSPNLIRAVEAASTRNVSTIALLGGSGGDLMPLVDLPLCVPASDTQRIQEVHILILHLLCEWIEEDLLQAKCPQSAPALSPVSAPGVEIRLAASLRPST